MRARRVRDENRQGDSRAYRECGASRLERRRREFVL